MKPILVFQTDFTYKEGAVSAMYGVVKSVDRTLEIIDSTHEIPKFDIWSASYRLFQPINFWPEGTIFVSVVDPGVGTSRKACVARTVNGYTIVTPDNGSLTHIKKFIGLRDVREIDVERHRLRGKDNEDVAIFQGRDVFGYCAAKLASGILAFEDLGPSYPVDDVVSFPMIDSHVRDLHAEGISEIVDPNFGNVWTNIKTKEVLSHGFEYLKHYQVEIAYQNQVIYHDVLPFVHSFGDAAVGSAIIYNNELNRLAFAINQGSFIEKYKVQFGNDYHVTISES